MNDVDTLPWLARTLAVKPVSGFFESEGARLHYLSWNAVEAHKPLLIFVHGYRAHAHWWDFIAPYFLEHHRVFALDLSGMGDSAHRSFYDARVFASDIAGLIKHLMSGPATVVAHSFGGGRVLRACADEPELFSHLIVVDSYVQFYSEPIMDPPVPRPDSRATPTRDALLERFRLSPPQATALPALTKYIAKHSIRPVEGGWDWKFDRRLPTKVTEPEGQKVTALIQQPVDVIYGEFSNIVEPSRAQRTVAELPNGHGPICIPEGHHHIMLTQPLALISALLALLTIRRRP